MINHLNDVFWETGSLPMGHFLLKWPAKNLDLNMAETLEVNKYIYSSYLLLILETNVLQIVILKFNNYISL